MTQQWYEALFANYAEKYDKEVFTQGTLGECDFIEQELRFDKTMEILDVGCGTGRHAIELSRRGYRVTGVDLSEAQISKAREKAADAGVLVEFIQGDARRLPFEACFDTVIMLCEGGFPLMETDEMNYEILKNATKALRKPGKLIFTTLNGLFPLFHSINEFHGDGTGGGATYRSETFDLMTFRDINQTRLVDDGGQEIVLSCNERYYVPSEITWLLKSLGYGRIDIFGARLGAFSREHTLATEDYEMLVVAEL